MVNYKNDELNQLVSSHHWIDETHWIRPDSRSAKGTECDRNGLMWNFGQFMMVNYKNDELNNLPHHTIELTKLTEFVQIDAVLRVQSVREMV